MSKKPWPTRINEVRNELLFSVVAAPLGLAAGVALWGYQNDAFNLSALWPKTAYPAIIEPAKPVQGSTTQGHLVPSP